MESVAYTILYLILPNQDATMWPNLSNDSQVSQVQSYHEKRKFIEKNRNPRYAPIVEYLKENGKLKHSEEPKYDVLKEIISKLFTQPELEGPVLHFADYYEYEEKEIDRLRKLLLAKEKEIEELKKPKENIYRY